MAGRDARVSRPCDQSATAQGHTKAERHQNVPGQHPFTGCDTTQQTCLMNSRFPLDPRDIFQTLNKARVEYLVVGGVAAIFHGVLRTTGNLDMAVHLEIENLRRLERAMTRIGFVPRVPASVTGLADSKIRRLWMQQKGMNVFSFMERKKPFRVVDIMVRPLQDFQQRYEQRKQVLYHGIQVPVIPIDALIRMKRQAGRPQDQEDVAYLETMQQRER